MGGFFGGGTQQRTRQNVQPDIGPAQERVEAALYPLQIEAAQLQQQLSRTGTQQLQQGVAGARAPLEEAMQMGAGEAALPGAIAGVNAPLSQMLSQGAMELAGPTPESILEPLESSFRNVVSPEIQSAAIRAGAVGGSAEQDLFSRAAADFGRAATGELARTAAGRMSAAQQGAQAASQLGIAGPQAEAQRDALERQLGLQRGQLPIDLANILLQGAGGVPGIATPFAPAGTTTKFYGTDKPTTGAEVGSGLGLVAALAMMSSIKAKEEVEPLDETEYQKALTRLRETPVTRWYYKGESRDRVPHIGPIAELSPDEIRHGPYHISIGDYLGLMHAGVKGLDERMNALEQALEDEDA
jgi:hypothetical protein